MTSPPLTPQPKEDSPELPDMTTLLVQTETLDVARVALAEMQSNDPYTDVYERALGRLLPALNIVLGVAPPEAPAAEPANADHEQRADAAPIETNW